MVAATAAVIVGSAFFAAVELRLKKQSPWGLVRHPSKKQHRENCRTEVVLISPLLSSLSLARGEEERRAPEPRAGARGAAAAPAATGVDTAAVERGEELQHGKGSGSLYTPSNGW
mmetsp:Transcript_83755/g.162880  ORF Transcript_83755/g.162880 Transcript_83755/m.162880 type:complete len:115 (+) Transcript_83755:1787-2131(+)